MHLKGENSRKSPSLNTHVAHCRFKDFKDAQQQLGPSFASLHLCSPQKILTHSYSRVVLRVLEKAAAEKKRFSVYVTESQPDSAG